MQISPSDLNDEQVFSLDDVTGNSQTTISLSISTDDGVTQPVSMVFSAFSDANLFPLSPSQDRNSRFNIGSPVIGATIINGSPQCNVTINIALHNSVSLQKVLLKQ